MSPFKWLEIQGVASVQAPHRIKPIVFRKDIVYVEDFFKSLVIDLTLWNIEAIWMSVT